MIGMNVEENISTLTCEEHEALVTMSLLCDALLIDNKEKRNKEIASFLELWENLSKEKRKEVFKLEMKINYHTFSAFFIGVEIQKENGSESNG